MQYQITVWKLGAEDVAEYRFECYCETYYQGIMAFDAITTGIRGHYKAWFVGLNENREIRYSSVTYQGNGVR